MKHRILSLLVVLALALLGAASVLAQEAEKPGAPEPAPKAAKAKPARHSEAVTPETVSGTLSAVDADKKVVVVTDGNGIPFDFVVNSGTKITVSGSKSKIEDLASDTNKQASVTFLALKKRGNVAKSIEIQ